MRKMFVPAVISVACILLLIFLPAGKTFKKLTAALLGIGSLGYSSFWMFAALTAPALGSTHDAKEALGWLAIPTAGLCILGLVATIALFVRHYFMGRKTA